MICDQQPRERFVHLPTPLEVAPRLSAALGINLLVKREDLAGLCVGGNKARLLEFAIGSLRDKGVDALIAHAAEQSNKLRDIAAVAARCGMKAVLLTSGARDSGSTGAQGNRLLDDILGAEVRDLGDGLTDDEIMAAQKAVQGEFAAAGKTAAILDRHLDYGTDATIAYVDAAEELATQWAALPEAPHSVFIAAGAGMTVAGLALGLKHLGSPVRVVGVSAAAPAAKLAPHIEWQAGRAAVRLGLETRLAADDLLLEDAYTDAGYGIVTPEIAGIVRLVARLHGMVVDPVYNAKVLLALFDHVEKGLIPAGSTVVYINTGGGPATFDYGKELRDDAADLAEKTMN